MSEITRSSFAPLYASQTSKPIPLEPDIISTATITNQATPIEIRIPVRTDGRLYGRSTWRTYFTLLKRKTRATFLWSSGTEATPKAVLITVGQSAVTQIVNTAAFS